MENKHFWLISVPNSAYQNVAGEIDRRVPRDQSEENHKWKVPELRVGTYDSLMSLSDDIYRIDNSIYNTVRKIARQYYDLLENKPAKKELPILDTSADVYVTRFYWDNARYPRRKSLRELTEKIAGELTSLDEELRKKAATFNSVNQAKNAQEQKAKGSLMVRDLSSVVTEEVLVETDYLTTLLVVVPRAEMSNWNKTYETLTEFVMPQSSKKLLEDNESSLMTVILFKRVADEFKNKAKEKRFAVRKFQKEELGSAEKQSQQLDSEQERLKTNLLRWCKTNFSGAFIAWIHLKCIRVFVESVLRFGLPVDFQPVLMLPKKRNRKRLRETLNKMFEHVGSQKSEKGDGFDSLDPTMVNLIGSTQEYYPYVSLDLNIDLWGSRDE